MKYFFKNNLAKILDERDLSVNKASKLTGLTRQTIDHIKKDKLKRLNSITEGTIKKNLHISDQEFGYFIPEDVYNYHLLQMDHKDAVNKRKHIQQRLRKNLNQQHQLFEVSSKAQHRLMTNIKTIPSVKNFKVSVSFKLVPVEKRIELLVSNFDLHVFNDQMSDELCLMINRILDSIETYAKELKLQSVKYALFNSKNDADDHYLNPTKLIKIMNDHQRCTHHINEILLTLLMDHGYNKIGRLPNDKDDERIKNKDQFVVKNWDPSLHGENFFLKNDFDQKS
ncbi:hypothetical protein WR164_01950 [Philodulcilactobacillus myokoensis]|uniref:Uncharacterized protein n=1 Tax=Philodulcilactobacillus myokoensis TaxID=2929573 RepID=A0A9W6B088_9LACO|nr:helix-turn-helix transcriptional regulator [Philodulcilactobacillus myokoensis]GLB46216.1 hypothetical protein WR164_01950 [Philodulcilactobacillus myokoensis]